MTCNATGCERTARGQVPADDQVPEHFCRQCEVHACELARYMTRAES